jgi:hypothetical protein
VNIKVRDPDADRFFRDIGLCVTTYRGRGPAMVWPAGAAAVVDAFDARPPDRPSGHAPDGRAAPPGPGPHAAEPSMREMADHLGEFVGGPVGARYWSLAAGRRTEPHSLEHDAVLLQLAGSCECRVASPRAAAGAAPGAGPGASAEPRADAGRDAPWVRVRLRAGEALYVARHGSYALAEVHDHCTLVHFQLPV